MLVEKGTILYADSPYDPESEIAKAQEEQARAWGAENGFHGGHVRMSNTDGSLIIKTRKELIWEHGKPPLFTS